MIYKIKQFIQVKLYLFFSLLLILLLAFGIAKTGMLFVFFFVKD